MSAGAWLAAAGAFGVTWLLCALVARAVPVPAEPFRAHAIGRALRIVGRASVVLAVLAVAVVLLGARPAAVTGGALAGWLVASAGETRRLMQRGGRA